MAVAVLLKSLNLKTLKNINWIMKTKTLILLAVTAIVTLSFTFASVKKNEAKEVAPAKNQSEQAGGFAVEDKI